MLEDVLNYLFCNASKLPYAEQTTLVPHGFFATQSNLAAIAAFMFTVLISHLLFLFFQKDIAFRHSRIRLSVLI
jgi:hypothetical protein